MNREEDPTLQFRVEPKRPARRFRTRVFFYLLILTLATSVVSGATYYSRQVKFIERDRARRAHTLLTSLATQAELGAYAADASLCDLPARRTFGEEDVVIAGVYDPTGKEILRMTSPSVGLPPPPPMAMLGPLLRDPDAPPVRVPADGYDDLWAPIVTSARPAAVAVASEPGGGVPREVVGLARVGLSLVPAREQLEEVVRTGLYLSVGLLLLGSLAALLIAGAISDPILALARGADEIRAGNFDVNIDVPAQDEVGLLAESFNRMAAKLRDTMAELEALNRNLESEVMRRTDEIRRSAEFTELLNAPVERDTEPSASSDLDKLLEKAVDSLRNAVGVRSAAILLSKDEVVEFELRLTATSGAFPAEFDELPTEAELAPGKPIVEVGRATIPILFRGEPEGAIVLHDEPVLPHAVEFAARAAGPLAIALSNVRAYAALKDLAHELTERNQALVKQRDQLSEMNRLKSEFLANVSHELRTPLNAILGYTELTAEGIYGAITPEQREALDGIEESSRNLLTLINQILDLSKVESGKIDVFVTEVEVHDVVQSVVAETQALAKARPYKVQVLCPARVRVKTDAAKLKQILTNLVTNAIKFTDNGGVAVQVTTLDGGGCTIAVKDTGIGIRPEDQQLIFEEFRQVDGSSTRRYSGTGLGLAIARRFAHLLSGTLTVESQLGVGSNFTLKLPGEPRVAGRPPAPPLPPARITAKIPIQPSAGRSK
jgi:signal transduction histidine kinase/HAMP domain-containing protein